LRTIQKENKEKLTFENCPDVMDGKEVAELLHVSTKTISRLATANEIDSFLIGTARRYTRRSLFKFIYERTGCLLITITRRVYDIWKTCHLLNVKLYQSYRLYYSQIK